MPLKTQLGTVKKWWKPENGTVSILALTMAKLQVKLLTGLIYISSRVERAMSKIQLAASATRFLAKETIARRAIEQIKTNQFLYVNSGTGILAQSIPNSFVFNNQKETILTITQEGDVIWNGKPSQAAEILVRTFQLRVEDEKGVTKAAKRRYYMLACKNILNKAERMSHTELVESLQKEVYNRERRVILDGLKNE